MKKPKINSLHWTGLPQELFCPACGKAIFRFGKAPRICQHVAFAHTTATPDFEYVSPRMKLFLPEAMEREDPVGALLSRLNPETTFCLQITTYGMACGPTALTTTIAVDFVPGPLSLATQG